MYIKTVQTLIEQGLQDVGVFAYSDMLPEELDLAINAMMFKMMDEQIQPLKNLQGKEKKKFKLQYVLDRFQNLQIKEFPLSPTNNGDNYSAVLPIDYMHLISDVSQVLMECNLTPILTGKIIAGHFYLVKGQKSIIYNTITYFTGSVFMGVTNVTGYTYSGTGTLLVLQLQDKKKPNRLTEEELLYQVLNNALEKTDNESPVSSLSGNILYIYVDGFYIQQIYLTYLRKPKLVNSQFVTIAPGTNLVVGNKYESVTGTVTYNTIVYQPFQPFIVLPGVLGFSGSNVRLYQDGDVEFTDSMSYNLVSRVIEDISIKTEQSQQKIVNLAKENV